MLLTTPPQIQDHILSLFDAGQLKEPPDEWGFTWVSNEPVHRIGYATNLTPEVAEDAIERDVGLVLTHHDAWPFLFGMQERCAELLHPHGISHCFIHAPLDAADFGTSAALARLLGLHVTGKCLLYRDVFLCGRMGEPEQPVNLDVMHARLEETLGEPVRAWCNNDSPVRRVCIATGGGHVTDLLKEAVEEGCDTYITGEKMLYTVQYARFAGINLLVGSHTATELPGVETLTRRIADEWGLEAVRLADTPGE